MIDGLNSKHLAYFSDMLIMANKYQLEAMGFEIIQELKKRRNRQVLEDLPRFPEI
jgi:hypothetical protein